MNTAILRRCLDQEVIGYQKLSGGRVGSVLKEKWETTDGVKILYLVHSNNGISTKGEIPPRIDTSQEQTIA